MLMQMPQPSIRPHHHHHDHGCGGPRESIGKNPLFDIQRLMQQGGPSPFGTGDFSRFPIFGGQGQDSGCGCGQQSPSPFNFFGGGGGGGGSLLC